MHFIQTLSFFIVALHVAIAQKDLGNFKVFKTEMEDKVQKLVEAAQQAFKQRCEIGHLCQTKTIDMCLGTDRYECHKNFPTKCKQKKNPQGAFVSISSGHRFADLNKTNISDYSHLSDDDRQFVCVTATLEDNFTDIFEGDRNGRYTLAYIGSWLGAHRRYPATFLQDSKGSCPQYDPRLRPWYVAATTISKNIIILIDTSGSMKDNKIKIAIPKIDKIIRSFSNRDYISIITFNSTAYRMTSIWNENANSFNKVSRLKKDWNYTLNELSQQNFGSQANYSKGFSQALSMIKEGIQDVSGTPCTDPQNIILFISDGKGLSDDSTDSLIQEINENKKEGANIRIFPFGIGSQSDSQYSLLEKISCAFDGITFHLTSNMNSSELADQMIGYYQTLRANVSEPIWSDLYNDAAGFGELYTVSIPIYYKRQEQNEEGENSQFEQIIGVAGLDIKVDKMREFGLEDEQIEKQLIPENDANVCNRADYNPCDLDYYRKKLKYSYSCQACSDQDYGIKPCTQTQSQDIFKKPVISIQSGNYCCPLQIPPQQQKDISIPLGVGLGVGILVLVFLIILVYKLRHRSPPPKPSQKQVGHSDTQNNLNRRNTLKRLNNSDFQIPPYHLSE